MLFVEPVVRVGEGEVAARPAETPLYLLEVGRNRDYLVEVSEAEDEAPVRRHGDGVSVTPVLNGAVAVASAPEGESGKPSVRVWFRPFGRRDVVEDVPDDLVLAGLLVPDADCVSLLWVERVAVAFPEDVTGEIHDPPVGEDLHLVVDGAERRALSNQLVDLPAHRVDLHESAAGRSPLVSRDVYDVAVGLLHHPVRLLSLAFGCLVVPDDMSLPASNAASPKNPACR